MMHRQYVIAFAAVFLTVLGMGSVAHADERDVSSLQFSTDGWMWVPTTLNGKVESFVGLRTDPAAGENITTVWYRQTPEATWESWAWGEQDQSKGIASVKSVLGLPDSTDSKWPLAPSTQPAEEPERLTEGVLESDPIAPVVESLEDPSALVASLESAGWRAAWIDIWEYECEDIVVLGTWVMAVDGTQFLINENGAATPGTDAIFANTLADPCQVKTCNRIIDSGGALTLIAEGDPGSVIAMGVMLDAAGDAYLFDEGAMSAGQALVQGTIENTGTIPVVFMSHDGELQTVDSGEEVVVVYEPTALLCHTLCATSCTSITYGDEFGEIEICLDPDCYASCYCSCWADHQPDPGWLDDLPDCPCELQFDNDGDPINPDPDVWRNLGSGSQTYHPGSAWCMRSVCTGVENEPGQQCCYDADGQLITAGEGGGTPDIVAPCGGWWPFHNLDPQHVQEDVDSYTQCKKAGMLDCYLFHRPPDGRAECGCNPPDHPHCTDPPSADDCESE